MPVRRFAASLSAAVSSWFLLARIQSAQSERGSSDPHTLPSTALLTQCCGGGCTVLRAAPCTLLFGVRVTQCGGGCTQSGGGLRRGRARAGAPALSASQLSMCGTKRLQKCLVPLLRRCCCRILFAPGCVLDPVAQCSAVACQQRHPMVAHGPLWVAQAVLGSGFSHGRMSRVSHDRSERPGPGTSADAILWGLRVPRERGRVERVSPTACGLASAPGASLGTF